MSSVNNLTNWDPAQEAFGNSKFNSYNKGLGKNIADSKQSTEDCYQLYVSGIPPELNSSKLKTIFMDAGEVFDTHILRSSPEMEGGPRCGFVKFKSMACALKAMELFNGQQVGKYTLKVQEARNNKNKQHQDEKMINTGYGSASNMDKLAKLNINPLLKMATKDHMRSVQEEINVLAELKENSFKKTGSGEKSYEMSIGLVPKGLKAGCKVNAVVLELVQSDCSLYCMLDDVKCKENLAKLDEHLNKVCSTKVNSVQMKSIKVGNAFACQFTSDQRWYRVVVEEVMDANNCFVRYIDYGNGEKVNFSQLKQLNEEFFKYNSFAFKCVLENLNTDNIEENVGLLGSIVQELELKIALQLVKVGGHDVMVDIYSQDDEYLSINQLLFEGTKGTHKQTSSNVLAAAPTEPQKHTHGIIGVQLTYEDLPNDIFEVVLTEAKDPQNFSCQYIGDEYKELEELMVELRKHCANDTYDPNLSVTVGRHYAAKFSADGAWYRAEILEISDVNKYMVQYVDYGNTEHIEKSDLRVLPDKFRKLKKQAFSCSLAGLPVPNEDLKWSKEASDLMKMCCGTKFQARKSSTKHSDMVLLDIIIDTDQNTLTQHLMDNGFVSEVTTEEKQAEPAKPEPKQHKKVEQNPQQKMEQNPQQKVERIPQQKVEQSRQQKVERIPQQKVEQKPAEEPNFLSLLYEELKNLGEFQVMISHVNNPRSFYCQRVTEDLQRLERLVIALTKQASELPSSNVDGGDFCAAEFTGGQWYRGKVLKKDAYGYLVQYIDYGNTKKVEASKVKSLPKKFQSFPVQAFPCLLSGCYAPEQEWQVDAVKLLQACENIALFASIKEENKNDDQFRESFPVVLYVDKEQILNDLMITSSFAVGSPVITTDASAKDQAPTPNETPVTQSPKPVQEKQLILDKQDLQPILKSNEPFPVALIHVNNPHSFYCQLVGEGQALLQAILTELTLFCSSAEAAPLQRCEVGLFCAAPFTDGQWYRSLITSVSGDEITVQYVDFGNTHTIKSSEVKKLPEEFSQVPIQAFECSLADCYPPTDGWSAECIENVGACANNVLQALCDSWDDERSVLSLHILLDEENTLNKCLVAGEMALDKPVKPKSVEKVKVVEVVSPPPRPPTVQVQSPMVAQPKSTPKPSAATPVIAAKISPLKQPEVKKEKVVEKPAQKPTTAIQYESTSKCPNSLPFCKIPPNNCRVIISNVESVDEFSCRILRSDEAFQEMQSKMTADVLTQFTAEPKQGDICGVMIFGNFLRCQIKLCEGSSYVVKCIDTGKIIKVAKDDLRMLPSQFYTLPPQSFDCKCSVEASKKAASNEKLKQQIGHKFTAYINGWDHGVYSVELVRPLFDVSNEDDDDVVNVVPEFDKPTKVILKQTNDLNDFHCNIQSSAKLSTPNNLSRATNVKCGHVYAVKDQDGWKRCRVLSKLKSSTQYQVEDVDDLGMDVLSKDALFEMSTSLKNLPIQTLHCQLNDCKAGWPENATNHFNELVDAEMTAVFKSVDITRCIYSVDLLYEECNILEQFEQLGLAERVSGHLKLSINEEEITNELPESSVQENSILKVVLSAAKSPSKFYCRRRDAEMENKFKDLLCEINEFGTKYGSCALQYSVNNGQYCIVKSPKDGKWRRGKVTGKRENKAKVFRVDDGVTEVVGVSEVLPLVKQFTSLPCRVFCCHLANLKPKNGETWTQKANDIILSMTAQELTVKLNQLEKRENLMSYAAEVPKFLNMLIVAGEAFNDFV